MAANIYQAVKQAMQDLIAPQLESLKGEIGNLRAEVNGLRGEMHSEFRTVRAEMQGELKALHGEMDGGFKAVHADVHRLDEKLTFALDLRERIVAIEARLDAERR